jgi:hypothetical protein
VENSTTFQIITIIIGIVISGTYPLFGAYLKMQEKKFTKLFSGYDKIEGIEKAIEYLRDELNRLRDKQGE